MPKFVCRGCGAPDEPCILITPATLADLPWRCPWDDEQTCVWKEEPFVIKTSIGITNEAICQNERELSEFPSQGDGY
jgi:hypothetical protein